MPFDSSFVAPELFVEHAGVKVYHTYDGDDINQGRKSYWYTLDELCGEDTCSSEHCADRCVMVFDVRHLPTYRGDGLGMDGEQKSHERSVREAIDQGLLTAAGAKYLLGTADELE